MTGVYKSVDYGETWRYAGLDGYNVFSLAALQDRVVAGTWGNGVFTLSDGDTAWINSAQTRDRIKILSQVDDKEKSNLKSRKKAERKIVYAPLPKKRNVAIERLSESHILSIRTGLPRMLVICYKVKNDGTVSIGLHDYRGKLKKKDVKFVEGGVVHTYLFCTDELKNGVYFITLKTLFDSEMVTLVLFK
ncbi:unnamed protein product [marine sediment metagenome]|uniref:Secretion system C-terminal sorting domain-containing protein n=1 Tax=marine sediment metagenome TaxID=412755 RepID=X1RDA7_9ZZZZ